MVRGSTYFIFKMKKKVSVTESSQHNVGYAFRDPFSGFFATKGYSIVDPKLSSSMKRIHSICTQMYSLYLDREKKTRKGKVYRLQLLTIFVNFCVILLLWYLDFK